MNDAENLSKLLGHLPPAVFREFMVDEFGLAMPDVDAKKPKKEQREQMEAAHRHRPRPRTLRPEDRHRYQIHLHRDERVIEWAEAYAKQRADADKFALHLRAAASLATRHALLDLADRFDDPSFFEKIGDVDVDDPAKVAEIAARLGRERTRDAG